MFPKSPFMGEVMEPARSSLNPRAVLFPFHILESVLSWSGSAQLFPPSVTITISPQ